MQCGVGRRFSPSLDPCPPYGPQNELAHRLPLLTSLAHDQPTLRHWRISEFTFFRLDEANIMSHSCLHGRILKPASTASSWVIDPWRTRHHSHQEKTSFGRSQGVQPPEKRGGMPAWYQELQKDDTSPLYQEIREIQDEKAPPGFTASNASVPDTQSIHTFASSSAGGTPRGEVAELPDITSIDVTLIPAETWDDLARPSEGSRPRPVECPFAPTPAPGFSSRYHISDRSSQGRFILSRDINTGPNHIGIDPLSLPPSDVQAYEQIMSIMKDDHIPQMEKLTRLSEISRQLSRLSLYQAYQAQTRFCSLGGDLAASFQQRMTQGRPDLRVLETIVGGLGEGGRR